MNRKRNRPDDWADLEPSPVVHVSDLPDHTLEIDLLKSFEQFGAIRDITMIPQVNQALIEFSELSSAENVVHKANESSVSVGNHRVRINYSTSKRIVQRAHMGGGHPDSDERSTESRVLLFTIYNAQYPINVDVIHQITARHGRVLRIVIFRKSHVQAMVEFKSVDDARNAKRHLNGADIYSGCCTLKVEFARPTRLSVTRNDQDTWDFENPVPAGGSVSGRVDVSAGVSLLGRFSRGYESYDKTRSRNGDAFGYSEAVQRSGVAVPFGAQSATFLDPFAVAVNPSLLGVTANETTNQGHTATTVVMIYNIDISRMNCDRLFNLLCMYGNVVRIKFLRTKEGSVMAQMGDVIGVDRVIRNLSGVQLMGNQLMVRPSKQLVIHDVPAPFDLPDGSKSYKDYSSCRENRFLNAEKAIKNRIFPPSNTLHYWNCPPNFSTTDLCRIFVACGATNPSRIAAFPSSTERSSSGLIEWPTVAEAVDALSLANHHSIPYAEGRFPYVLKLSFSNNPLHDRASGGNAGFSSRNKIAMAAAAAAGGGLNPNVVNVVASVAAATANNIAMNENKFC